MVTIKKGDLVRMEFTGRVAATGAIFETTDETLARKIGIYEEGAIYGPKLAIFGNGNILPGMEEAIVKSTLNNTEQFVISADKAFGEKLPHLVRMIPEKEFARQNIKPVPGMVVGLDRALAKVKSVTSGRVVVDFNHPLAGETVSYSIKVVEVIADDKKKLEALCASLGLSPTISQSGSRFSVSFSKSDPPEKVEALKQAILAAVPGTEIKVV
ncbi:MAG: peptidylprolyl isomerase [Candidatus Anstonellaceae archaeon]